MTGDLPTAYHEQSTRARKPHECCECHKTIPAGMFYIRATGIWDKPKTYKMCERCDRLSKLAVAKYPPDYPEEGPAFGLLRDWIRERNWMINGYRTSRKTTTCREQ